MDLDSRFNNLNIKTPSNAPAIWTTSSTGAGPNNNITWYFNGLQPNEVRYLYVEAKIPPGSGSQTYVSTVTMKDDIYQSIIDQDTHSAKIAAHPRDPNYIEVDYDFIPADYHDTQQLRYDVGFFNDGNWFIKDVFVDITLDNTQHDISTLGLIESSAPCTISYPSPNVVRFSFDDIYLPGQKQSPCSPSYVSTDKNEPPCNQIFSWDDVNATFSFNVCTNSMLPSGQLIAEAEITFVGYPIVPTTPASTTVEPPFSPAPPCGTGTDQDQDFEVEGLASSNSNNANSKPIDATRNFIYTPELIYPNPFNTNFTIPYEVTEFNGAPVDIRLYNSSGQELEIIFRGMQKTGQYSYTFDTYNLASGVYFVRMQNGGTTSTQRVVKLR